MSTEIELREEIRAALADLAESPLRKAATRLFSTLGYDPESNRYYRGILQNIFFIALNRPMDQRRKSGPEAASDRSVSKAELKKLAYLGKNHLPESFEYDLFDRIPYLNGGLFDALREDNASDTIQDGAFRIPDKLFYATAAESARKASGSYYTPRRIVDYMVNEALHLHLRTEFSKQNAKEEGFWHLVTRDQWGWNRTTRSKEKERLPELNRAGRLPWARPIIDHECDDVVFVWDFEEETRDRSTVRTYAWLREHDYVVILERQAKEKGDIYMLVTSFLVEHESKRRDLQSRYERRKQ